MSRRRSRTGRGCHARHIELHPGPIEPLAKGAYAPNGTPDTRLFWSRGSWTASQSWPPPAAVTPFVALDGTQYGVNGNPAVATDNTVYFGESYQDYQLIPN